MPLLCASDENFDAFADQSFCWLATKTNFVLLKYDLCVLFSVALDLGWLLVWFLLSFAGSSIIEAHNPDKLFCTHVMTVG